MTDTNHTNRRGSVAWALALSLLSSVLLVALAFFLALITTVSRPNYMKSQIRRSNFAGLAYDFLSEDFSSYGAATGFDSDVICSALSVEQINTDMEAAVDDLYAGNTQADPRDDFKAQVNNILLTNLAERGIEVTEEIEDGVDIVADACRLDYTNYVAIPLAGQLFGIITKINRILLPCVLVSLLFCIASLVLTVRLAGSARLGLRCVTYSFISGALVCLLCATALYPLLGLDNLTLRPESLRSLVLCYLRGIFGQLGIFAAVFAVAAAVLLVLQFSARKPRKNV